MAPLASAACPRLSGPYPREEGEENDDRQQNPTVGRSLQESNAHRDGGGGEDREKQGVVEPAKRFRIHDTKLHEYAEREVRNKEDHRDVEDQCLLRRLILEGYSTGLVAPESTRACDAKIRSSMDLGFC
jgi:hypothetical protein